LLSAEFIAHACIERAYALNLFTRGPSNGRIQEAISSLEIIERERQLCARQLRPKG
jgi:hypothetical protein